LFDQYGDAAAQDVFQAVQCSAGGVVQLCDHGEEAVECAVDRQSEQFVLAGHVVVDRGLGDAQFARQVFHAGAVVAAFVEQLDGHQQEGFQVVAWAAALRGHGGHCRPGLVS
jgi:hypothetical protein